MWLHNAEKTKSWKKMNMGEQKRPKAYTWLKVWIVHILKLMSFKM
jgi:hypothetical protein